MKRAREQYYYISVNSEDRVSGTENKYTVTLPRLLQNVIQIELLSAEIPNTLYPTGKKYLYFAVHVNENAGNNEDGHMFLCRTFLPEGVYNHDDAAVQLTNNMDVFKHYLDTDRIRRYFQQIDPTTGQPFANPADNEIPLINQTTHDIAIAPDSPHSEDELARRDQIIREDQEGEGFGPAILDENARSDHINDPMAPYPDRQSELGYVDPTQIAFGELDFVDQLAIVKANLFFKFDSRLGKFLVILTHAILDNIVIEEARTDREFGFDKHKITENIPYVLDNTKTAYYAHNIAQLHSSSHIWMTIDELASMPYWNVVSTNKHLPRNVFARIQMATDILHWVFWSQGVEEFKRECAPGQTTSLSQLTIGWLDHAALPVDFHGIEHSLVLRVTQSPPD